MRATERPVEEILLDFAADNQFDLLYHSIYLVDLSPLSIDMVGTAEEVLNTLLSQTDISYKVDQQTIELIRTITIFGTVRNARNHESMISATVYDPDHLTGTYTNQHGYFSFTLPYETDSFSVAYVGFKTKRIPIDKQSTGSMTIFLDPDVDLQAVTVRPSDDYFLGGQDFGIDIIPDQVEGQLSTGGEPDLNQHLMRQPGISSGPDGLGGLHVRGGNSEQNLILLDGVRVFQPNHAFGLFSIFNTSLLKSAEFSKDAIHPKYSGGISSVVDISIKEGSTKRWNGDASVSTIASTLQINGPLIKDKAAVLLSFRRSHLDSWIKGRSRRLKLEEGSVGETDMHFYDIYGKMHFVAGKRDRVYVSFYKGYDEFEDEDSYDDAYYFTDVDSTYQHGSSQWSNQLTAVRWTHIFGKKYFGTATLAESKFDYGRDFRQHSVYSYPDYYEYGDRNETLGFKSKTVERSIKYDLQRHASDNVIDQFGLAYRLTDFDPATIDDFSIITEGYPYSEMTTEFGIKSKLDEYIQSMFSVYTQRKMDLGEKNHLAVGGRYDLVQSNDEQEQLQSTFHLWNARLSFSHDLTESSLLRFDATRNEQATHLLSFNDIGFPNDLRVPAIGAFRPQSAWSLSLSAKKKVKETVHLSISAYYKAMDHIIGSSEDDIALPVLIDITPLDWEHSVLVGSAVSKGIESNATLDLERFYVDLSYTLSKHDRTFEGINGGRTFPFTFDQRHNLSASIQYQLGKKVTFYTHYIFNNGVNQTLYSVSEYYTPLDATFPEEIVQESDHNGSVLPAYHRLDVGLRLHIKKKLEHEVVLGIQNVLNTSNSYYQYLLVDSSFDVELDPVLQDVRSLPMMPLLRWSVGF